MATIKAELQINSEDLIREVVEGVVAALDCTLLRRHVEPESLLDIPVLAKYLSVTEAWLYQRVHANEIPHFRVGKYVRFRRAEVEIWLQDRQKGERKPADLVRRGLEARR
jgi:excisionase family DNA binding protein